MTRVVTVATLSALAFVSLAVDPEPSPRGLNTVVELLTKLDDSTAQADVLRGISDALKGRRQVAMPQGWKSVYAKLQESKDPEVRAMSVNLALVFGDADAQATLRKRASDARVEAAERIKAIDALAEAHDPQLAGVLLSLLDDPAVRDSALRDLPAYSDAAIPSAIIDRYPKLSEPERRNAITTLAARAPWGIALLDAVEAGKIPHADVSAFVVRQLTGLHDKKIDERLKKFYGNVRPPAKDKAALINTYKRTFKPDLLAKADLANGRAVFTKTCAACHTLFDKGGHVGPELTGSQRANLDYILENVVDPSAVVARDYYMTVIDTKDGQTLTGIVKQEDVKSLTLRDTTHDVTLSKSDIKTRRTSPQSMMPEGLLEALSTSDARDLIAYLQSPVQVPEKK